VRKFPLRPIRSERELDRAIAVIDALLDKPRRSRAAEDYLDVLGDLVKRYEDEAHPIEDVSARDVLEHLIEAKGATQAVVARETGIGESRISEILSGKRRLTMAHVGKLACYFHVSPAVFFPA